MSLRDRDSQAEALAASHCFNGEVAGTAQEKVFPGTEYDATDGWDFLTERTTSFPDVNLSIPPGHTEICAGHIAMVGDYAPTPVDPTNPYA